MRLIVTDTTPTYRIVIHSNVTEIRPGTRGEILKLSVVNKTLRWSQNLDTLFFTSWGQKLLNSIHAEKNSRVMVFPILFKLCLTWSVGFISRLNLKYQFLFVVRLQLKQTKSFLPASYLCFINNYLSQIKNTILKAPKFLNFSNFLQWEVIISWIRAPSDTGVALSKWKLHVFG